MKKRISALLLALVLSAAIPFSATALNTDNYSDVEAGTWYYDAVDYSITQGLFSGMSPTKFGLHSNMTRAMFITVLGRQQNVNTSDYWESPFTDVPNGQWYSAYIAWVA